MCVPDRTTGVRPQPLEVNFEGLLIRTVKYFEEF